MGIKILDQGISQLVDQGRVGLLQFGITEGQPQDADSALVGRALLGDRDSKWPWWIEVGPVSFSIRVLSAMRVTIAGAARSLYIDGVKCLAQAGGPLFAVIDARSETMITLGAAEHGTFSYIACGADLDVEPVYGSRGSNVNGNLPGLLGRRLKKGDFVPLCSASPRGSGLQKASRSNFARVLNPSSARVLYGTADVVTVRFLPGPEFEDIFQVVKCQYEPSWEFIASSQMDRMAIRLSSLPRDSEPLAHDFWKVLGSSTPTVYGMIQWPVAGEPMILGQDRQTMGGYPRFGVVIAADRALLGRLHPGRRIRLTMVDRTQALEAFCEKQSGLDRWTRHLRVVCSSL